MSGLTRRGLLGALGSAMLCPRGALASPQSRSILYISSDEHNASVMGRAGHPLARTPNLDRFFAQSLELGGLYTNAPVCAPTRQSWLTGLLPMEHGQLGNAYVYEDDGRSLVHTLSRAGYQTACFGKLHTNSAETDGRFGFDRLLSTHSPDWEDCLNSHSFGKYEAIFDENDLALFRSMPQPMGDKFSGKVRGEPSTTPDWVLLQEARSWLRDRDPSRPFFCYVSFRFPHYPFDLPRDFYYAFDPAELDDPPAIETDWQTRPAGGFQMRRRGWDKLTRAHTQLLRARYLGAIAYLDWLVGELLKSLEELGLAEDTLVAYSSDHGDMAGEKGLWLKDVMYEGAARKPAALRLPGVLPAGARSTEWMGDVDLLPTVMSLAGLQPPTDRSGTDRSAALLSGRPVAEATFAYDFITPELHPQLSMVRTADWKLVDYDGGPFPHGAAELYQMGEDPAERHNLAAEQPAVVDALRGLLRERSQGLAKPTRVQKKEGGGEE